MSKKESINNQGKDCMSGNRKPSYDAVFLTLNFMPRRPRLPPLRCCASTAGTIISSHEIAKLAQRRACLITICIMCGDFGEPSSPLADSAALNSDPNFREKVPGAVKSIQCALTYRTSSHKISIRKASRRAGRKTTNTVDLDPSEPTDSPHDDMT